MRQSILYNLKSLPRFRGQDDRATFWPYAILILILAGAGIAAVMLPEILGSIERAQQFATEHPELATVQAEPGGTSIRLQGHHPELLPDMGKVMTGLLVVFLFAVLLLAGAVARRLHDTGRSGLWGLLPIPFFLFGATVMPQLFAQPEPDTSLFSAVFLNNLLYLASLAVLVVMLRKPGRGGASRQ